MAAIIEAEHGAVERVSSVPNQPDRVFDATTILPGRLSFCNVRGAGSYLIHRPFERCQALGARVVFGRRIKQHDRLQGRQLQRIDRRARSGQSERANEVAYCDTSGRAELC